MEVEEGEGDEEAVAMSDITVSARVRGDHSHGRGSLRPHLGCSAPPTGGTACESSDAAPRGAQSTAVKRRNCGEPRCTGSETA